MVWEMEPATRDKSKNDQNVFARVRNLPSVSLTLEVIGGAYTQAKAANPLLSSVCEVCEQGVRGAGSLAAQSVQPAMQVLQPQPANSLACRGLDRLEEKMPALEYPPVKLAAGISELVSSAMRSPAVQYVLSNKISRLAEQGAGAALTFTESLVDYILPASSEEREASRAGDSDVGAVGPKPGLARLGSLAATVCKRAYVQTAAQLQRTRSQGQQLVARIPSVTPLEDVVLSMFSDLGNQLKNAYTSVVAKAKDVPLACVNLAKDCTVMLSDALAAARGKVPDSLSHNMLLRSSKPKEATTACTDGEGEKGEEKKSPVESSPALESNGAGQINGLSHNPQEDSVKDGEATKPQPAEEHRPGLTKQILEIPVTPRVES